METKYLLININPINSPSFLAFDSSFFCELTSYVFLIILSGTSHFTFIFDLTMYGFVVKASMHRDMHELLAICDSISIKTMLII